MKVSDIDRSSSGDVICNLKMTSAIKTFQKDAKLQADGIAGTGTIRILKGWLTTEYTLGDRVLKKGMKGTDVTQLKNLLMEKGFMKGEHTNFATLFDDLLENVIMAIQKTAGIEVTGEVNKETLAYIKK